MQIVSNRDTLHEMSNPFFIACVGKDIWSLNFYHSLG